MIDDYYEITAIYKKFPEAKSKFRTNSHNKSHNFSNQ